MTVIQTHVPITYNSVGTDLRFNEVALKPADDSNFHQFLCELGNEFVEQGFDTTEYVQTHIPISFDQVSKELKFKDIIIEVEDINKFPEFIEGLYQEFQTQELI